MAKSNNQIIIFDTTLRDGEQSPGASMSLEEKVQIARAFEDLGVDVMEAGFPAASNGDFEAVSEIAKILKKTIPCGLARAVKADIEKCRDALKHAKRFRIHTFLSTSPLHMKHKLKKTPKEVLELIKDSVSLARRFTDDVEWSPEDGTRTTPDFLCKTVELAIKCGAKTINIPDTVGYTIPDEYYKTIKLLFDKVPNIDKAVVSTHCHNDLGLAVANSLAGVKAGARQIECTINGIGERAGNAALEEIVMAIKTRSDLMPYKTNINTKKISSCSKLVANVTGFPVQFNKAIVGRNAFKDKAAELGYPDLSEELINNTFKKFKDLADKKKHVFDEDIIALVDDDLMKHNNAISLSSLEVIAGTKGPQKAKIELMIYDQIKKTESEGDGPVDAIFKAIKKIYPHNVNLQLYQVQAVTEGTDAQATVSVRIEEKGKISVGQAADTDTLVASAKAYINALNKLIIKRKRTAPSPDLSASA